ncbi:PH domain-containing protein [Micromonospora sp. NPDC093277]|uniref:PH domain-containing protein n=1 Tax=Micromonospora sp. NPDC093277 TaxID=3364291 RepID=UPI00380121E9
MTRRVYRVWFQTIVLTAAMAVFLLISVSMFTVGDEWSRSDPFSLVLYSVIGVGSLFGIWLALRMGVVVDERGIRIRNFGRGRFIRWQDVAALSCEVYDVRLGFPLYAPVVRMAVPSEPSDAASVPLAALGSYRSRVAQRRTGALAALVPPQRTAPVAEAQNRHADDK